MADAAKRIAGLVERVAFQDDESGFAIFSVRAKGEQNLVVAAGNLPDPVVGEELDLTGEFSTHPKYGPRFNFTSFVRRPPLNLSALKKYLGGGLIKGVGPVLADRIVERFGEKSIDILDKEPERLTEVPGLGAGRREMIATAWRKAEGLKRLLNFLAQFGLGPALAVRVTKTLGPEAEALIREDPYRLAWQVEGIGFISADKVARHMGLSDKSPQRLKAGLLYVLSEAVGRGHSFLPERELYKGAAELLPETARPDLEEALASLIMAGLVNPARRGEPGEADIYLPQLRRAEKWVSENISDILSTPAARPVPRPEAALAWVEGELKIELAEGQREALSAAFREKMLIITGGPGTGKTTITRAIVEVFSAMKARVALAAPTGRAAKRLSQATGFPAKTIHRLLEYSPAAGGFLRGPKNKLEVDLLLLDEASMIDILLMNQVTGALPPSAALILVGDRDQLPPVGPGQVLADLCSSGRVPVVTLNEIYRQAAGSLIIRAAHQINRGIFPDSGTKDGDDFYFIAEENPEAIREKILRMVTERLPKKLGLDPLEDIQILTPMHQGDLGTESLNELMSRHLNPNPKAALTRGRRVFKTGDRVMQIKNNYERDVFNGDRGLVTAINFETQELGVDFDGRGALYDFSDLDELIPAYAISIHKSQGSDFPAVIIPLTRAHHLMLKRNLVYTAVTRATRFAVIIGSPAALKTALASPEQGRRHSALR